GTGLEAAVLIANKIALGQIESGGAGGGGTTTHTPIPLHEDHREGLLAATRATSTAGVVKALAGLRPGQIVPEIPANREPGTGMSMGEHAAITAAHWGIERTAQDE